METFSIADSHRTEYDVGKIFRDYGQEYELNHALSSEQRIALRGLASCRTADLGGHLERCSHCGFERPVYNSCRNRNCPKCQGSKRMKWINERLQELLPVPYFHLVFTVPAFFNELMFSHYREFHNALFHASSGTLLYFFRKLGAIPAIIALLHTWGQSMCQHPHVHILVTGGGLSKDQQRWIKLGRNWLFDIHDLSAEFKKRFLRELECKISGLEVPDSIREQDWVVHCRKPFAGAAKVVEYIGRYTYRSVISNRRIVNVSNGKVTIDWKDYRDCDGNGVPKHKLMVLDAAEFIRRFIQHIPPANFMRNRFYGIIAGANRKVKLAAAREQLIFDEWLDCTADYTYPDELSTDFSLCPQCETGTMEEIETLLAHGPPPIIFRNEIARGKYAA